MKWLSLLALLGARFLLMGQSNNKLPAPLEGVGIEEKIGSTSISAGIYEEKGYQEPLSNYFKTGRPVLLNLVYYNCPMLCNLLLNGQMAVLREIPQVHWRAIRSCDHLHRSAGDLRSGSREEGDVFSRS